MNSPRSVNPPEQMFATISVVDEASLNALKSRLERGRRSLAAQPARSNVEQQLLELHEAVKLLLEEQKP